MKIAILGGSFDPVHYGHLQMGKEAMRQCGCDEVWLMPTYQTPLKNRTLTSSVDRVAMLELAIQDQPHFHVCTLEVDRKQRSYTIDTLRTLRKQYPMHEFYWIIGNDQLAQFSAWKDADTLVKLAQFICFDRDQQLVETSYPILRLRMPMMPVSSSEIRIGNKLNYVPKQVLRYMYDHRLYIEQFVQTRMNDHRFRHSVSVAHLCEDMAIANGLDGQKAYLIGLFHDIAKAMPLPILEQWMDALYADKKSYAPPVWHGFVGCGVVQRIFYIEDPEIHHAIYHHVLGTSDNPYAMIVFCADKTDPLRGYDSSAMIAMCKEDIARGFQWVCEENKKYLESES